MVNNCIVSIVCLTLSPRNGSLRGSSSVPQKRHASSSEARLCISNASTQLERWCNNMQWDKREMCNVLLGSSQRSREGPSRLTGTSSTDNLSVNQTFQANMRSEVGLWAASNQQRKSLLMPNACLIPLVKTTR